MESYIGISAHGGDGGDGGKALSINNTDSGDVLINTSGHIIGGDGGDGGDSVPDGSV